MRSLSAASCALALILAHSASAQQQQPIEFCWAGGTAPNHCDPGSDMRYDIWQANCHTAANVAVCSSPLNTGVVICGGQPEAHNNPGDHTFNYVIGADGNTTYWNWGNTCGPCPGAPPQNLSGDDCHSNCVRQFCADQYNGGFAARCLPPGQMVEIPGPSVCATQISRDNGGSFDASLVGPCRACCDARADVWPNSAQYCQRGTDSESFRAACKYLCEGFFLNGHPSVSVGPATCPYFPSVMACVGGVPTTLDSIQTQCAALPYARPTGTPEQRRCYFDCVNNTRAAQVNCNPAAAVWAPLDLLELDQIRFIDIGLE